MHKYFGYDSFIATYKNDDYENLKLLPGLRIEFIPKIFNIFEIDSLIWLTTNAKRIDVLNTLHFNERSKRYIKLFKKLNPSGKAYLKLDDSLKDQNISEDTSYIDFISIEFKEYSSKISKEFQRSIGFVPNPVFPGEIQDFIKFKNRENIIIFTGRIDYHKGCHTLLEAFIKIHDKIPNWKLQLTGKINDKLNITNNFSLIYPGLKDKVIFTGKINNRTRLP